MEHLLDDFQLQYEDIEQRVTTLVYTCDDFVGHGVTVGTKVVHGTGKNGNPVLSLVIKAAVCSTDDVFDKELGVDIVLGRLQRETNPDFEVSAATGPDISESGVESLNRYVNAKLERLAAWINEREAAYKYIDSVQLDINKSLSEDFEEFK